MCACCIHSKNLSFRYGLRTFCKYQTARRTFRNKLLNFVNHIIGIAACVILKGVSADIKFRYVYLKIRYGGEQLKRFVNRPQGRCPKQMVLKTYTVNGRALVYPFLTHL